jgi:GntR family transcriptional regulator
MEVNKKSPIPVYYQLKQIILKKIKDGIWLPGDAISSERELCDIFNVSRMTIRQAINELVNEGILYREKGKGTFVSPPRVEQMNIMSFTEAATNKGLEAVTEVKILEIEIPDLYIIEKLGLSDYEDVYYMQRVRKANGQIIGIEEIYLPVRYCRDFEKKDLSSSLYKILRDDYGYAIDHIETSLEAVIPEINELKLFKTEETVPIMKVTGVNVTDKNLRLFYEESIYRSDKYVLNVNIYRK